MENNYLGKVLRQLRGEQSLRDFAQKCGISHTHLDSLEKGYDPRTGKPVRVSLETLKKISTALEMPLDAFVPLLPDRMRHITAQQSEFLHKINLAFESLKPTHAIIDKYADKGLYNNSETYDRVYDVLLDCFAIKETRGLATGDLEQFAALLDDIESFEGE